MEIAVNQVNHGGLGNLGRAMEEISDGLESSACSGPTNVCNKFYAWELQKPEVKLREPGSEITRNRMLEL